MNPTNSPSNQFWAKAILGLAVGLSPLCSFAGPDYVPGPAAFSFALVAKMIAEGTVSIDAATGKPLINQDTGKPFPDFYATGAKTFDRAGRVTSLTDSYAGKILGSKYGNAQFLADLLSAGVLPDTIIKGWGIFALRTENAYRLEARKLGKANVDLSDYIIAETSPIASNYNRTRSGTYKSGQLEVTTGKGSFAHEGTARISFGVLSDAMGPLIPEFDLDGSMVASGSEYRWYPDPAKKSEQRAIDLRTGVKVNSLLGTYQPGPDDELGYPSLLVTGSASVGPEKPVLAP